MGNRLCFSSLHLLLFLLLQLWRTLASQPSSSCQAKCGSLTVKYPLGTGFGCGSPRFNPYVTCSSSSSSSSPDGDHDQLLLTTHTGSYPITAISYATSTLTITPPNMSTCSSMQPSQNLGIDWPSPFQLGPSVFVLLSCPPPTSSSLTVKGLPICDSTYNYLCASIHTCPAVASLGLSLFAPTNTCCVYSPANLDPKGDLDLKALGCASYASVLSLGQYPTDPNKWEYGVALKYNNDVGSLDSFVATNCEVCERSGGACGYGPPRNYFLCVCNNGVNTSTDCYNQMSLSNSVSVITTRRKVLLGWIIALSFLVMEWE
ncbi:wall-associated receptor kinase-like 20 [Macadamia integrifolia]|uniref:wall-associated receptor kinase-like 20 n=1 Tax=Macadamia integrifolia TaxID=60698 RepID=UPI001C4E7D2F|nr:wall-associated receptor kinase-like 20 [Macadamia integrifolia]